MQIKIKAKRNSDSKLKTYKIPLEKIDWIEIDNETSTFVIGDNSFVTSLNEEDVDSLTSYSFMDSESDELFDDENMKITKGELITIGKHKFRVDTSQFNLINIETSMITIVSNFLLKKNDFLITLIENIEGVEGLDFVNDNDYQTNINVGELFDIVEIKNRIEEKIKENLES